MLAALDAHGSLGGLDYVVVVVYMLAMMAVGVRFRGSRDTDDYLLGGRSIPWWLAGISYLMTLLSTISMVAVPGEAYNHGITMAVQNLVAPLLAVATFHLFIRFYFKTRMFTPFDYLERRFDARIRAFAAGFYWLTRVMYLGVVLYATSKVFEGACGWPKYVAIILTGGIGVAYTVLGGLNAVVWTDLIQFFVLVGGMAVLLAKVLLAVPGGAAGVIQYAFAHDHGMPEVSDGSFFSLSPFVRVTLLGIILYIGNDQLFYNSAEQMAIQRLLSTSSYREAKRSLYSCVSLQVPVFLCLWFIGLAIFAFYSLLPPDQRPDRGDAALYHFIGTQLPAPLPGLIIAAMLAAVMSTIAGGFNSLTTVATVDFYQRFFRPRASQNEQLRFSRWVTLLLGVCSIVMGLLLSVLSDTTGGTVVETSFVWLSLVWVVTPVFLLGVLSRRATGLHAMIALLIGGSVTAAMISCHLLSQKDQHALSFMFVGVPGPVIALAAVYVMSRFSPRRPAGELDDLTLLTLRSRDGKIDPKAGR